jgi:hypothetical protein
MKIKRLNEQFAQSFSGDGFNSSNGVFKVKYKAYADLSQPKGREINPYDHIKGEEIQMGDYVKARVKGKKDPIEAEVIGVKRSPDGRGTIFKVKDLKNNKIYNLPSFAVELHTDRGNTSMASNSTGATSANKEKFLNALKYAAGNFVWSALESKLENSKADILLKEGSDKLERPGIIDPSVSVQLIDTNHADYKNHIENFKKMGIIYSIPEEKKIFIHKSDPDFKKLNDKHLITMEAVELAKCMSKGKKDIDEKYNDVLAAQILRNKGHKDSYKLIASNFMNKHGVSYGECADDYVPSMQEYFN